MKKERLNRNAVQLIPDRGVSAWAMFSDRYVLRRMISKVKLKKWYRDSVFGIPFNQGITKASALFLTMAGCLIFGCSQTKTNGSRVVVLPYYKEATFTPQWFNDESEVPENFHRIPEFSLINQEGENINAKGMQGKVSVVDFFFTTCPGICPKMTKNMMIVQEAFMKDDKVQILSHSVTPGYDSVSVLKKYADHNGITKKEWHLLTGRREEIYDLGRYQYFVEEDLGLEKDPDDFLHTENFILIDQSRYIRGIYNGLNKSSVNQLIEDIKTLRNSK